MQPEQSGIAASCHQLEIASGSFAVAAQLGCLSAQKKGERLVRRDPVCFLHEPARRDRIPGADRHQSLRHCKITARAAPSTHMLTHENGRAHASADQRPQHCRHCGDRSHCNREHHDRGLDTMAKPRDGNVAGPIGKPDGAKRQ